LNLRVVFVDVRKGSIMTNEIAITYFQKISVGIGYVNLRIITYA